MEKVISPSGIIGTIIGVGICLGVVATAISIILMALKADPDYEDQEDQEIYEHNFWKNKNKKA